MVAALNPLVAAPWLRDQPLFVPPDSDLSSPYVN